jgi:hypothetical protein
VNRAEHIATSCHRLIQVPFCHNGSAQMFTVLSLLCQFTLLLSVLIKSVIGFYCMDRTGQYYNNNTFWFKFSLLN